MLVPLPTGQDAMACTILSQDMHLLEQYWIVLQVASMRLIEHPNWVCHTSKSVVLKRTKIGSSILMIDGLIQILFTKG